jgi:hypothetical protein
MLVFVLLSVVALVLAAGAARAFGALPPGGHPLDAAPAPDVTQTKISPSSGPIPLANQMTINALVKDIGGNPAVPTGSVSWDDGGAGGTIVPNTCILGQSGVYQSQCSISYTAPAGSLGASVTLTANYVGDSSHLSSSGQSTFTVYLPAVMTISPSAVSATNARPVNFTGTVKDTSISASTPQGTLSWNDGGAGGSFSKTTCNLAVTVPGSSACWVMYTGPGAAAGAFTIMINASYTGDSSHAPNSAISKISFTPAYAPMTVNFVIMGSSKGAVPPVFTYSHSNMTQAVVLTAAPATYQVDVSSVWFVPNQLGNSSQGAAWNLLGAPQGVNVFSTGTSITFVYYHQYLVTLGYRIVGGTEGASVPPFVTYTSFGVTRHTGAPGTTWVDVGTAYSYAAQLPGSFGGVRWLAQNVSGTATGPADLSVTYYHQFQLSVSFGVRDSPTAQAAPVFFASSMGSKFNVSLASLSSKLWLDAGSQYSLTDPLVGGNSTVQWSAGGSSAGLVGASDISVTYFRQNAITVSFKIPDNSLPERVTNGVAASVSPSLAGQSGGQNVNVPLTTGTQTVWLDSGTSYTISKSLLVLPGEKWIATEDVAGKVTPGATAIQTYYHEYLVRLSYSKDGASQSAMSITYTLLGTQASASIATQGSAIWVDGGSKFFVQDVLAGDRWFAPSAPDGLAFSANMTVVFYHQYLVSVSLKVDGGGLPAQSSISGTSGGQQVRHPLGAELQTIWLDAGSTYSIPQNLLAFANERWVAPANLDGAVTSTAALTQEYYHQVLLNVSSAGLPPAQNPLASYTSFGSKAQRSLLPIAASIWADAGTTFSVQNALNVDSGERWFTGFPALNLTAPFQAKVQYFHQYALSYTFATVGGSLNAMPEMIGQIGGKNSTVAIADTEGKLWLDEGSSWRVAVHANPNDPNGTKWQSKVPTQGTIVAPTSVQLSYFLQYLVTRMSIPSGPSTVTAREWSNASSLITLQAVSPRGWTFGGWVGSGEGAYSGPNATVTIPVVSSISETAQFDPRLTVISSNGGSVKFTTGSSFQTLGGGQSVQTFIPANGTVTLQATAAFPYSFVKWVGVDGGSSSRLTVNVNAPTQIQAVFEPSYTDIIGIPLAVFVSALTMYLARGPLVDSGREVIRNLRRAFSD